MESELINRIENELMRLKVDFDNVGHGSIDVYEDFEGVEFEEAHSQFPKDALEKVYLSDEQGYGYHHAWVLWDKLRRISVKDGTYTEDVWTASNELDWAMEEPFDVDTNHTNNWETWTINGRALGNNETHGYSVFDYYDRKSGAWLGPDVHGIAMVILDNNSKPVYYVKQN